MTFTATLLLLAGGALGTWARWGVSDWFKLRGWAPPFPWGTFVINVSGSFILGVASVLILKRMPVQRHVWYLLIGTGFCGGYTTFSTFSLETFELMFLHKQPGLAVAYAAGSVLAGFAGAALGWWLMELAWPPEA